MRGIAAVGVLVSHVAFATGVVGTPVWGGWLSRLEGFVNVFFVLSGFVLFRPYALAAASGGPWPRPGRYLVRRALRILPAYWVLLVVGFLVVTDGIPDPLTWLRHATLTHTYWPAPFLPGVAIAWTLAVEVVFYALLPVVAMLLLRRRWRPVTTVVVLLLTGFAASIGWLSQLQPGQLSVYLHTNWFPSFAMCFAVGMALAVARVAGWRGLHHAGRAGWVCWGLALELYAFSVYLAGPLGGLGIPTARDYIVKELLYLGFATLLLLPLVAGAPPSMSRILGTPVLRWVGTVSYGLFLWHLTVIELIADVRGPLWGTDTRALLALTLAGGLALAAVSWYAIERPALRLADRITIRPAAGHSRAAVPLVRPRG